mgnify:CR=1 FL=1
MPEPPEVVDDELTWDELLPWLEFGCWTALVLTPILYYVNGPSVSSDQAAVRTGLVVAAAVGGVLLRLVNRQRVHSSKIITDE